MGGTGTRKTSLVEYCSEGLRGHSRLRGHRDADPGVDSHENAREREEPTAEPHFRGKYLR